MPRVTKNLRLANILTSLVNRIPTLLPPPRRKPPVRGKTYFAYSTRAAWYLRPTIKPPLSKRIRREEFSLEQELRAERSSKETYNRPLLSSSVYYVIAKTRARWILLNYKYKNTTFLFPNFVFFAFGWTAFPRTFFQLPPTTLLGY